MTWLTFQATTQKELIEDALESVEVPKGITLRVVRFTKDLVPIRNLPVSEGDTMVPNYGMAPEDADNELTLIAEKAGRPVAQISADFEMINAPHTSIDAYVNGIFVSSEERGQGIAAALGKAMVEISEDWRQAQASHAGRSLDGDVSISGYAHPQSRGQATLDKMTAYAEEVADSASRELSNPSSEENTLPKTETEADE